ncbi:amino acid adenylation domain-containing protein [Phormidium tenue FACHB-886]|nr:amino acid adenylation domain-containing protein [Phormidium tenue FACHB-886]
MTRCTIAEFLDYLKSLDIQVSAERNASENEIRLRCSAPQGTLTLELQQQIGDRKAELLAFLDHEQSQPINATSTIQPRTQATQFPLSFAQQRLWFLSQLAPDNPFYNVPAAIRLQGTLNLDALENSFNEIVRRHAALRTTFETLAGQPVQVVAPEAKITIPVVNLRAVLVHERHRITQQLATAEAQRNFDLSNDLLLRVTLLQYSDNESILLLTLHHIVADGWSLGVLIRELACLYTAGVEGRSPALPTLPIQYTDFACWQREWLQGKVLEEQLAYWRSQLQDLSRLALPTDRPRPTVQTYQGATYPLQFSPTLTQALEKLSQQEGVSLFMTLLAAFQALLYRYTEQTDIAVGSPIANRHRSELEGLIGFFVNSLVLRTDLSGNPTVRELLQRVRNVALAAYAHQDLPFEKLVEELDPERDLSHNPLFQVALALQNAPMQPLELPGIMLEPLPLEPGTTRFDLEVHLWEPAHGLQSLWESQAGLSGFVSYSTDLFDRATISRFVGHFKTLLEGLVANPDDRLLDLPLLSSGERQQLAEWNQSDLESVPRGCSEQACFHEIFEAQAQQFPQALALVSEQGSLTYGELNQKADRLAQMLRQMGVQPGSLVGLCVDRSADMVVGILGILKAGGGYLPLDPSYPSDRLRFMLTDTQVSILLTQSWLVETLPTQAQLLCLDRPLPPLAADSSRQPSKATADSLAYVIYTSGSTGTPKGVLLSHRGLSNVVVAQRQAFPLCRESRVLQFSSLCFDASIFEMALAFGSGGALYIPPKMAQLPGTALVQFLEDNAITHALLIPAVLTALPTAELPALQVLITGGEACSQQVVDRWAVGRRFFNAYGPTEATIWATVAELHPGEPISIGRPVANMQVYLLDAALNPVPVGLFGEIYIGGVGVAQGYLNHPELTAERFIENPFSGTGAIASRLYKTGDRARCRADGSIEFQGRADRQIKIRGFRVELDEIEAALQGHAAIQNAAVVAAGEADDLRLVAYFSLNRQAIQHFEREQALQQIQHWQMLYNQTYRPSSNSDFNITGWNSSYTGQPIPAEQMREWVDDRVQQILALKPQRVLEIGCGTGLLLFQIASHCQEYWGTDFSTVALESIQHQLANRSLSHVKLLHRLATDFSGIDLAAFDVVILNSVVQYFPSIDYLMQVLEGAMRVVAPGGVLFIGDVRSLPLLTAFHTGVQISQAEPEMDCRQLRQQVERSRFEEPELTIDPAFFPALSLAYNADDHPQIRQVQIRLARGCSQNEMTQFRYNVLLHLEADPTGERKPAALPAMEWLDWQHHPVTVADIQKHLLETKPEIFGIMNIANDRVAAAVRTADWLFSDTPPKTVGRLQQMLQDSATLGSAIDPQVWWDLETVLPYRAEIGWSSSTQTGNSMQTGNSIGNYDVVLIRHGAVIDLCHVDLPKVQSNIPDRELCSSWSHYTNEPLQSQFASQLTPELRQFLGQTLPGYMVPSAFVPLETLPLMPNGKVDRRALPLLESSKASAAPVLREVQLTQTEATLIHIWEELLRLKRVTPDDNFFELGGHSLLATQMTSRIRDAFRVEMPLQSVFETPTIAQLASVIETLQEIPSTLQAPPLVRLDRAAHRRLRSVSASLPPALSQATMIAPTVAQSTAVAQSAPALEQPTSAGRSIIPSVAPSVMGWSPLVPLTLGKKSPMFCVHPMFGVVFPYLELARHLRSDRSFYGLQPFGLDGQHSPFNEIEAMATYYIQAIQTMQPQGPYFLSGWSFGGLVAFEMAQQLTRAGQQVELLAILDTPAPLSSNQPSLWQSLKLLKTAIGSLLPFLLDYGAISLNRQAMRSWNWSRWQWLAIAHLIPEESRLRLLEESAIAPLLRIFYANTQAAARYVPQHYANRITLFQATEQSDRRAYSQSDATLGWNKLAKDIQLHSVPGNHLSMLRQPHVQTLADQLQQYLV